MRIPELEWFRRRGSWSRQAVRRTVLLALLLVFPVVAQNGPQQPHGHLAPPFGQQPPDADDGSGDPVWRQRQLRLLNIDRQKSLVADTNKLLELARELDAEISSTSPASLTADQLRRVAEIAKLAHSVREKMSTSVGGGTAFRPAPTP
jgi:hypothetical protein